MAVNLRPWKKPSPCVITTFEDGDIVAVRTEERTRRIVASEYEPADVTYRNKVVVTQETGEQLFIGKARDRCHATMIGDAHLDAHPEHLGYEILPL